MPTLHDAIRDSIGARRRRFVLHQALDEFDPVALVALVDAAPDDETLVLELMACLYRVLGDELRAVGRLPAVKDASHD